MLQNDFIIGTKWVNSGRLVRALENVKNIFSRDANITRELQSLRVAFSVYAGADFVLPFTKQSAITWVLVANPHAPFLKGCIKSKYVA